MKVLATAATIFSRVRRGAAALDQVQVLVALVGAVDVELQLAHAVQLIHRDAVALEALGGGFGAGDGAVERGLVLASRSMKKLAVEPVPTPTMLLSSREG
jgi:FAD/FMN-containing dehydrogenase